MEIGSRFLILHAINAVKYSIVWLLSIQKSTLFLMLRDWRALANADECIRISDFLQLMDWFSNRTKVLNLEKP